MSESIRTTWNSIGLLLLRLGVASMMIAGHGWPKLADFSAKSSAFADPLGIGSTASLGLAVFGEVICSLLVGLGLFTRLSAIPLLITMLVAAFLVHGSDPWANKELAVLYGLAALTLVFTGAGALSVDGWRQRR